MYFVMSLNIQNWLTQIKKGYLELCILSLIKEEGRAYGFQLIALLEDLDISIKEGTLYPMLNRMTKDGLLEASWETEDIKGHPRKFYALTKAGAQNLGFMQDEFQNMYKVFEKIKFIGGKNGKQRA